MIRSNFLGIPCDTAVLAWRDAHMLPEWLGEIAGIVKATQADEFTDRVVSGQQQLFQIKH